jgi:hypothetical protein
MYWNIASVFLVAWLFLSVTGHRWNGLVDLLLAAAMALFAAHVIHQRRRRHLTG